MADRMEEKNCYRMHAKDTRKRTRTEGHEQGKTLNVRYEGEIDEWIKLAEQQRAICSRGLKPFDETIRGIIEGMPRDIALIVNEYEPTCILYRKDTYDWKKLCWDVFRIDIEADETIYYNLSRPKPRYKNIISKKAIELQQKFRVPEEATLAAYGAECVVYQNQSGIYTLNWQLDINNNNNNNIEQIVCGYDQIVVKMSDNLLIFDHGKIRMDHTGKVFSVANILQRPNIIDIACGSHFMIVLTADRKLFARGKNDFTEITGCPNDITDVVCGEDIIMVKRANGVVLCSGDHDKINEYSGPDAELLRKRQTHFVEISMEKRMVDYIFQ